MKRILSTILLALVTIAGYTQGTQLLRQPTISADNIVFVYANDLWQVSRDGGNATRLTSNEGAESLPHFSPDGKQIAFSAQYGGNTDVYIMPSTGGMPTRLTWHPYADFVQGWTPDGKVIFRSGRESRPTQTNKLYTVGIDGALPTSLPVPRAAYGEMSTDGKYLAYVPITGWDPEWRNYRGGQAMPIWIVDLETKELVRTPQPDKERHLDPVWYDGIVYFLSEQDYASNIWSFDPNSKESKQVTFHKQFDVKSLDATSDAIVYEYGGYLHLLDPDNGTTKQLDIAVVGDLNYGMERWEEAPANRLTNARLSNTGQRAIFEYRGEIFTVPKENGSWRNLTNSSGVANRTPVWSTKGDKVAWFSDESGEYQLVTADQNGQNLRTYPLPNHTFYYTPEWSNNGKHISYTDTDYNIWFINLNSGIVKMVDTDRYAHPNRTLNPVWSPDSKWIAYAKQLDSHFKAIFAYNITTGQKLQLTDGMADAISPQWDANGKYLYFLASTDYGLASGWLDMSSYDPTTTRALYAILLAKDTKSPHMLESDEEKKVENPKPEESKKKSKKGKKEEPKENDKVSVQIDMDNIARRIVALQSKTGNFVALEAGPKESVFYAEVKPGVSGLVIQKFDTKKLKAKEFVKGVNSFTVSADRSHVLYRKGSSWEIVESKAPPKMGENNLKLGLKFKVDPQAEYKQIFREGWRYMRDFLYVDNVHGAPWDDVWAWYSPWIDHVRHRTDLNYVVDIMSGEVAVGHSYVRGGDMPDVDNVPIGLLGADLIVANGKIQIKKIYNGESWNPSLKAPLHVNGIEVKEGDYILSVNNNPLDAKTNPFSLFEETAGRQVRLGISSTPNGPTKEVVVKPIANDRSLRSFDWIEGNRRKVDELSGGKLAYVYLPNTGGGGFTNFNRYYFAQQDKKGVIIDERNNGGGSAADYMIDVMNRKLFGYFNSKAGDNRPWTTPISGIWGPKVMIINERAGSGGDLLPYMFKEANLGPLVGTRTWGGLVGTWDTPPFIDGGRMVAPRGGFFDADGKWAVEGEGISPDIEVIQEPKLVMEGRDPQLEKSVEEAMRLLEKEEFFMKPEPEAPIRSIRPKGFKK
ncbi:MAG: PDZ domain-containing protein [Bacteroidota bacterium]